MNKIEQIANDNAVFIASEEFQKVNILMLMKKAVEENILTKRAQEVFYTNKKKGFHDDPNMHRAVYLMMIVSELSEALEADRKNKYTSILDAAWMESCCDYGHLYEEHFPEKIKDTHEDEIADALIRILDYCGKFEIDIEKHVKWKLEYNKNREAKHGKRY